MSDDDVTSLLRTGRGTMPPVALPDEQRAALLDFLMRRGADAGPPPRPDALPRYFAVGDKFITDHEGYPGTQPPWGTLDCLDLNTGKRLWSVPLGEYDTLTRQGVPKTGTENFGGPTVTAGGLVFCAGTRDSRIRAFDKDTGAE